MLWPNRLTVILVIYTWDNSYRTTYLPKLLSSKVFDQATDQGTLSNFGGSNHNNQHWGRFRRTAVHSGHVMLFGFEVLSPDKERKVSACCICLICLMKKLSIHPDLWNVLAMRTADWTAKALGLRLASFSAELSCFFSFFFSAFGPLCLCWCRFCFSPFFSIASMSPLKELIRETAMQRWSEELLLPTKTLQSVKNKNNILNINHHNRIMLQKLYSTESVNKVINLRFRI